MAISAILGTILVAAAGGSVKLVFSHISTKLETRRIQKMYLKAGEITVVGPPPAVFQGPTQAQVVADQQFTNKRAVVQGIILDAELSEAQAAMARLRKSLDQMTHELSERKAEVVVMRSMYDEKNYEHQTVLAKYEELKAASEALKRENEMLRREGGTSAEPRKRTDAFDRGRGVLRPGNPGGGLLPGPLGKGGGKGR